MEPGTHLAHYEIVSALGKGGMGEVWRARDSKLGREVAIKTLPPEFAQDADRLARFEREAKLLASLNHPNIAAIYGLEEHEGSRFLVLELVEGDTLGDRIKQGAIPVEESLKLALQIADALKAAHESGVIHRDLKPDNIKVSDDGNIKVLDFGLAKALALDEADFNLSNSPTLSMAATQAGVILGTAAYMSPEQAKGRALDRRADIWAFGCVLFEMLTGRQSFGASDVTESLAAVIRSEPEFGTLPSDLHPRLRETLERCLEKQVSSRYQDIGDARNDIENVLADPSGVIVERFREVAEAGPRSRVAWVLVATLAIASVTFAVLWLLPMSLPRVMRFEIHAPPGSSLPMGTPAISADGSTLAYTVVDADGVSRIHVRPIDRIETRVLPGTERAIHPFWSPDGRSLAFARGGEQLMRIDLAGGSPRGLANVGAPWHGTWNVNDDILFVPVGFGIRHVSAEGGAVTPVITEEDGVPTAISFPEFLTDGERFLFREDTDGVSSIQLGELGSTERTLVLDNVLSAPILASTPTNKTYLLFMREPDLMVQEFDEASGAVQGNAVVLVSDIGRVASPAVRPAVGVSPAGILAYQTTGTEGALENGLLTWLDRSGTELRTLPTQVSVVRPNLSPDQSSVVGIRNDTAGNFDVWITDLERESPTRLTFGDGFAISPVWSPDGERVAFRAGEDGIYSVEIAGGGEPQQLTGTPFNPSSWSQDGQYVLADRFGTMTLLSVDGTQEPVEVGSRNGNSAQGVFSPNGRYIAFLSDESGSGEVYVQDVPPGTRQWKVSIDGGNQPQWRSDGRELFFVSPDDVMMAVNVESEEDFSFDVPVGVFPFTGNSYDVSQDGQEFLIYTASGAEVSEGIPITVVVNWWVELEERLR